MAIVPGAHPPSTGDAPQPWGQFDEGMPIERRRWEIPLAGTNQLDSGLLFAGTDQIGWDIRGIGVMNRSTRTLLLQFNADVALGDLNVEADVEIDPFKVWSYPVYRSGVRELAFSIIGPATTEAGLIELFAVPIFVAPVVSDIAPYQGPANGLEPYSNQAFASGGDTGVLKFVNSITSVILFADTQDMQFYLGRDSTHMTGPQLVKAGTSLSIAGEFGSYRVVNSTGSAGGYRITGLYSSFAP